MKATLRSRGQAELPTVNQVNLLEPWEAGVWRKRCIWVPRTVAGYRLAWVGGWGGAGVRWVAAGSNGEMSGL